MPEVPFNSQSLSECQNVLMKPWWSSPDSLAENLTIACYAITKDATITEATTLEEMIKSVKMYMIVVISSTDLSLVRRTSLLLLTQ
jgi:hypothetical protein